MNENITDDTWIYLDGKPLSVEEVRSALEFKRDIINAYKNSSLNMRHEINRTEEFKKLSENPSWRMTHFERRIVNLIADAITDTKEFEEDCKLATTLNENTTNDPGITFNKTIMLANKYCSSHEDYCQTCKFKNKICIDNSGYVICKTKGEKLSKPFKDFAKEFNEYIDEIYKEKTDE